ncbi:hypothetical protein FACS1894168_1380 [Deltaproteobacteria bacterium]|nr:hypothetical protein FACS1894168_1380 [Deltaproteobacteria bacterium]
MAELMCVCVCVCSKKRAEISYFGCGGSRQIEIMLRYSFHTAPVFVRALHTDT